MSADTVGAVAENLYVSSTQQREAAAQANKQVDTVSKDEFLQLLVEQLRHQDPLNPLENQEFMVQLAQLQALDQQISMTQELEAMRLESQIASAAQMIGSYVTGETEAGLPTMGTVVSAVVSEGTAYLKLENGDQLALSDVRQVDRLVM